MRHFSLKSLLTTIKIPGSKQRFGFRSRDLKVLSLVASLFISLSAQATVYDVSGIPAKNTGDAITASEVNLIVDMLRNIRKDDRGDADATNDRVGIGVAGAPGYMLDVNGTVNASAFKGDGSQLTNLPNPGVWQITANDIYYSTGKVAIGINSSPTYELEVHDTVDADVQINAGGIGNDASLRLKNNSQEWVIRNNGSAANNFQLTNLTTGNVAMNVNSTSNNVDFTNIVGVGTEVRSPQYCDENGANCFSLSGGGGAGGSLWNAGSVGNKIYYDADNVGIGIQDPAYPLHVVGNTKLNNHLAVGTTASINTNRVAYIDEDFGTNVDNYLLMVQGTASGATTGVKAFRGGYFDVETTQTESGGDNYAVGIYTRARTSGAATFKTIRGLHGIAFNDSNAATGIGSVVGVRGEAYNNNSTGTVTSAYGNYGIARGRGVLPAGPVTNLYGTYSHAAAYESAINTAYGAYNYARTVVGDTGAIGTAYGTYSRVNVDSAAGGDITTGYGVYSLLGGRTGSTEMTTATGVYADVNHALTAYGGRFYADDPVANLNYGIVVGASGATNNYGIFGTDGDWVLDADGDGGVGGTGSDLLIGEGADLRIYHNGTDSVIQNQTGDLVIQNNGSGNVGVGTSTPSYPLVVSNAGAEGLEVIPGVSSGVTVLQTYNRSGNSYDKFVIDGADFQFRPAGSTNIPNQVFFSSTGDVMIGDATADGTLKLDVEGQVGATEYCDENGANCTAAASLGGGLWTSGTGSAVYYNGGNVGIGVTNPNTKLHLSDIGPVVLKIEADTDNVTETDTAQIQLIQDGGAISSRLGFASTNSLELIQEDSYNLNFGTNDTTRMSIDSVGEVGIGTTNPLEELHVRKDQTQSTTVAIQNASTASAANVRSDLALSANGAQMDFSVYGTGATGTIGGTNKADGAFIRTGTTLAPSSLNVGTGGAQDFKLFTNDTTRLTVDGATGNVGIGVTNPTEELHVRKDQASPTAIAVQNASAAAASNVQAGFTATSDGTALQMWAYGTAATGSLGGQTRADAALIRTNSGQPPSKFSIGNGGAVPLHFFTGDTTRMTINGNGGIGIGTVAGGNLANGVSLALGDSDTGIRQQGDGQFSIFTNNAERVRVSGGGNVGIGTNNPSGKLQVSSANTTVRITGTGTGNYEGASLYLDALGVTGSNAFNQLLFSFTRGTIGDASLSIQRRKDGAFNGSILDYSDTAGFGLMTATSPTATTTATRLQILPNGDVGIGTTGPSEELHVFKSQANPTTIVSGNTSTSTNTNTRAGFTAAANGGQLDMYHYSSGATGTTAGVTRADAAFIRTASGAPSSSLNIGNGSAAPLNLFTTDAVRMTVEAAGDIGIGLTNPSEKLEVAGTVKASAFIQSSDKRLKHNIKTVNDPLDVLNLRGVTFNWNGTDKADYGFIAQEMEKIYPALVVTNPETDMKAVNYSGMSAILLEALKAQQQQIETLNERLSNLETTQP